MQDLDGRKVGVHGPTQPYHMAYLAKKFGINPELVRMPNLTSSVVALKLGSIDSFMSADAVALRLVDSGELRILLHMRAVVPKPYVSLVVFATEDLISENPDLVRRFVKATLETVKYLKENPAYASDLFSRTTGASKDLSDKTILQHNWTPDGRGGGRDLLEAVRTTWRYHLDSGGLPSNVNLKIEDAVDARFLP